MRVGKHLLWNQVFDTSGDLQPRIHLQANPAQITKSTFLSNSTSHSPISAYLTRHLQSRTMDDLVINNQLPSPVIDNQGPYTSPSIRKRTINLGIQTTLIDHR